MSNRDYAIIVSDMARSVSFYRDTLGLPLEFESPNWTAFATEGGTVALHLIDSTKTIGEQFIYVAGLCQPRFAVEDLDSFHL